ncbi:hypothetical protein A4H97_31235 [Niastella yeongjuensis]|uniref:Outer membrane protein beta-barrel domain-containing protein n=1 Tax=Niastella yeongjuensis TaxID=354355 RepID=A0A1V9EJA4_9BACT|nr:hypothetical protein [Niastella yeongjuensis]OQP46238.1 hypothetical protein A4H97_31235 [Niastella yeongjuensis]SEP46062.1 hypothetical protein SAMN05660816_06403 [Niastella yeongjuensis]
MKKIALVLFIAIISATTTHAQFFEKGTNVVSAGIGLGGNFGSYTYGSQTPGLSLQYERGVWDIGGPGVISLGGYLGTKSYKYSEDYGPYHATHKWNYTIIGLRSAYHYNGINNKKFDVYGGLMLSYNILSYKYSDNAGNNGFHAAGSYNSGLGLSAFVGGRYLFTEHIGAFAELGYGVSILNLGLAIKF